jgi:hypothetical protein
VCIVDALGVMAPLMGADRLEPVVPKLLPTLLLQFKSAV